MQGRGHLGLGLLVYAPLGFVLLTQDVISGFVLGMLGAIFWSHVPDIDLRLPVLSHRGLTHTYLTAIVAGGLTAIAGIGVVNAGIVQFSGRAPFWGAIGGFLVGVGGVLSHLAGDVITPMGIAPKQPFDDTTYTFDLVYASNRFANIGFAVLGTGVLAGIVLLAGI